MEQGSVLRLAGQFGVQLRHVGLNPFGTGQCLTTNGLTTIWNGETMSQSLWNRAVSYDNSRSFCFSFCNVSIPLEQGSVLRQIASNLGEGETRLNPFGTGQCLTTNIPEGESLDLFRLNPFGTGQCLTTELSEKQRRNQFRLNPFGTGQCLTTALGGSPSALFSVSIPLEQGSVLRLVTNVNLLIID